MHESHRPFKCGRLNRRAGLGCLWRMFPSLVHDANIAAHDLDSQGCLFFFFSLHALAVGGAFQ